MDEQESAKISYANFVKRMERLNDDYRMLIDSITYLREKMYTLCDSICEDAKQVNPKSSIDKSTEQQQYQFNATSSFHQDYQYIQDYFEITTDKQEQQQFIKDIAKDFWKLYLRFSLQDGNRVNLLFVQAKALSYVEYDDVVQNREILKGYFLDQNDPAKQNQAQATQNQNPNPTNNNYGNNNNNSLPTNPSIQQII